MENFLHTEIENCIACVRSSVREAITRPVQAIYDSIIDGAEESTLSKAGWKVFAAALCSDNMSKIDLMALAAGTNFGDGVPHLGFRNPNVITLEGEASIFSDDLPLIHAIKRTAQEDLPSTEITVRRVPQAKCAEQWSMEPFGTATNIRVVRTPVSYESGVSLVLGSDQVLDLHYSNALCERADEWAGVNLNHLQMAIKKGWATDSERIMLLPLTEVLDNIASGYFDDLDEDDHDDDEVDRVSLFDSTLQALRNLSETLTEEQYATINRLVIRSVARCQKRWADRSKGTSAKLYKFVKENEPTSISPELAEMFIKAYINDGCPAETQSELFYMLGDFKRSLEARIKVTHQFDRAAVVAEWKKACVEQ